MAELSWRGLGLTVLSLCAAARGQCPELWTPSGNAFGEIGAAFAATPWDPDGAGPLPEVLVVGGDFHYAGGRPISYIAVWDGQLWSELGGGLPAEVKGLVAYNGTLWAATESNYVTGLYHLEPGGWVPETQHAGGIAGVPGGELIIVNGHGTAWAWNGVTWRTLPPGSCAAKFGEHNGQLISAQFGHYSVCVKRLDGSTWTDISAGLTNPPQWGGIDGMQEYDGNLYLAGDFYASPCYGIARWDGHSWSGFGTLSGIFSSLTLYNASLVAGGYMQSGTALTSVASWDGQNWTPLVPLTSPENIPYVYSVCTFRGDLVAAGRFTNIAGVPAESVARWDGARWHDLGGGVTGSSGASVSAVYAQGTDAYVGGYFMTIEGRPFSSLAQWNGAAWADVGGGVDGAIQLIAPLGGNLVIAGHFRNAGGLAANNIAEWNGSTWRALGDGLGTNLNSWVYALQEYQGLLYAAGRLLGPNGEGFARWNGTAWEFIPTQLPEDVDSLAVYHGELYVGGGSINVTSGARGIARWNGSSWLPVGSPGEYAYANAMAVYSDLLLVGTNTVTFPQGVIAWDGQQWREVGSLGGQVFSLVNGNGLLIAAGQFSTADGAPARNVAVWDGTHWSPLGGGVTDPSLQSHASAAAPYAGGWLVGGNFTLADGQVSAALARWGRSSPACYANCDCSAAAPVLNVNDFVCFLTRFATGDPWANCDGSTASPALNVNDMICFQSRFVAGCR